MQCHGVPFEQRGAHLTLRVFRPAPLHLILLQTMVCSDQPQETIAGPGSDLNSQLEKKLKTLAKLSQATSSKKPRSTIKKCCRGKIALTTERKVCAVEAVPLPLSRALKQWLLAGTGLASIDDISAHRDSLPMSSQAQA